MGDVLKVEVEGVDNHDIWWVARPEVYIFLSSSATLLTKNPVCG
jgi:hypothetical protein